MKALAEELGARVHHRPDDYADDGWRPVYTLVGDRQEELQQVFRNEGLGRQRRRVLRPACRTDGGSGCDGDVAVQRGTYRLLHIALWRRVSLRAVPFAERQRAAAKFLDIWRHSPELNEVRSITLRDLPGCSSARTGRLHPLSRTGLHGRQHARVRPLRTARSPSHGPGFRRSICKRRSQRWPNSCKFKSCQSRSLSLKRCSLAETPEAARQPGFDYLRIGRPQRAS